MRHLLDRGFQSHSSSADVRACMRRFENIRALARRQEGFGLIELLTAMVILAIAVAALLTAFTSSTRSLGRAGERGTATTLVERQLELYRKLAWKEIRIKASQLSPDPYPTVSATDSWFPPSNPSLQVTDKSDGMLDCPLTPPATSDPEKWEPDPCAPVQNNVPGPDHHLYRIDTYIQYESGSTTIKRVWVAVYRVNGDDIPGSRLARASSSYARFNYT